MTWSLRELLKLVCLNCPENFSFTLPDDCKSLKPFKEKVVLFPEILDEIINHLYDDKPTLLTLGLVSKQAMKRSRSLLFSTVLFHNGNDRDFDAFLALLEARWTSFSAAVRRLHLHRIGLELRVYNYETNRNLVAIIRNLPNVKSLWLTAMTWVQHIPVHILTILHSLPVTDVQIDKVTFTTSNGMRGFLLWLPDTVKSIALYNAQDYHAEWDEANDAFDIRSGAVYQRRWHLNTLDTYTLVRFRRVWEPFATKHTTLSVHALHLQLSDLAYPDRSRHLPFLSQFIQSIGPSVKFLSMNLRLGLSERDPIPSFEMLGLSHCTNLRKVQLGLIEPQRADEVPKWVSLIWKLLSPVLATSSPTEIILTFQPGAEMNPSLQAGLERLLMFPWLKVVTELHERCQYLKRVTIRVGTHDLENRVYLDALRGTELKKLEDEGLLGLQLYQWKNPIDPIVTSWPVHWRDTFQTGPFI